MKLKFSIINFVYIFCEYEDCSKTPDHVCTCEVFSIGMKYYPRNQSTRLALVLKYNMPDVFIFTHTEIYTQEYLLSTLNIFTVQLA